MLRAKKRKKRIVQKPRERRFIEIPEEVELPDWMVGGVASE